MQLFKPADLVSVEIQAIKPGQLFFYPLAGRSTLAIGMDYGAAGKVAWLNLTGPQAFLFSEERTPYFRKSFLAPCTPEQVRVMIDFRSGYTLDDRHSGGLIAIGHQDDLRITGNWAEHTPDQRERTRAGVVLKDWTYTAAEAPTQLLWRWSLGYVDETSTFVELVRGPDRDKDKKIEPYATS